MLVLSLAVVLAYYSLLGMEDVGGGAGDAREGAASEIMRQLEDWKRKQDTGVRTCE